MDAIISFFTFLQGLGVSVMMPIIITIIGCCLGAGFGKSLRPASWSVLASSA